MTQSFDGKKNYHNGLSAEQSAESHYTNMGAVPLERRWRGAGCEIDLIFELDDSLLFVEVKRSKTHARAAEMLNRRQISRIALGAESYAGKRFPDFPSDIRIDAALVDDVGRVKVLENISM